MTLEVDINSHSTTGLNIGGDLIESFPSLATAVLPLFLTS